MFLFSCDFKGLLGTKGCISLRGYDDTYKTLLYCGTKPKLK